MNKIEYADSSNEAEIMKILDENDMGLAIALEKHLVLRDDGIKAVAAVIPVDNGWHLASIASASKGGGYGGRLLSYITEKYKPITTISRGVSAGFYKRYGFRECCREMIDELFRHQCDECPDSATCGQVYLLYGGI